MMASAYAFTGNKMGTDLESIVERLYPFFAAKRTRQKRQAINNSRIDSSQAGVSLDNNDNSDANPSDPMHQSRWQDDPSYQETLRWLDELAPESRISGSFDNSGSLETQPLNGGSSKDAISASDRMGVSYSNDKPTLYSNAGYDLSKYISKDLVQKSSLSPAGLPLHYTDISDSMIDGLSLGASKRARKALDLDAALELAGAIQQYHTSGSAGPASRRQDKLDVIPVGTEISQELYSLDLKIEGSIYSGNDKGYPANDPADHLGTTLMRVKTLNGVETVDVDSSSAIAKAYKALDSKGLVGIFEESGQGEIELKEIRGLEGSKLELKPEQDGGISITYRPLDRLERNTSDFEYLNRDFVLNPESKNHGYDFMKAVEVTEDRALDSSLRQIQVTNEKGMAEQYEVRNNSAIAIMADAISDSGYTPEIVKMDVLTNDGESIESGVYIKNAYKTDAFGESQALIKDTNHGGLWVELSKGKSRSEFVNPAGCSLNLERATPLAGQVIEARLGVVGRYDNRMPE